MRAVFCVEVVYVVIELIEVVAEEKLGVGGFDGLDVMLLEGALEVETFAEEIFIIWECGAIDDEMFWLFIDEIIEILEVGMS